jgi:protein O-mannosyl-transferase
LGKANRKKKQNPIHTGGDLQEHAGAFPLWVVAALCLVAFLAYAHTLSFDFVYDDDGQVLRNPWIRDWSQVGNFFFADVWSFTSIQRGGSNYYRPFHMLAHAIGYAISGLKPWGFHLINILLHCFNTWMVVLIARRLTRDKRIGIIGGLIFALHPVHAESVSWVAGVTDPLCAVFYFSALYVYLNEDPSKSRKIALYGALLFFGALLSKEMAFTLPLMALWWDICSRRKYYWGRYAAMAASFGVYTALRIHALNQFNVSKASVKLTFHDQVLSSVVLMGEYLAKAFVPFNINAFHVFHPTVSAGDIRFLASALMILGFIVSAWIFRKNGLVLFLIGFIPISLIPVLNITSIGENVFADRYLYIPSLASCLLIALLIKRAAQVRIPKLEIAEKKAIYGMSGGICLVFAFLLYVNSSIWSNNILLYTETLKHSPDSAIMSASLAWSYFKEDKIPEAEYWLHRSEDNWKNSFLKSEALYTSAYVGLSSVYLRQGKYAEALEYLHKAYALAPRDTKVLLNYATVLIYMKNYDEARKIVEETISINPRNEIPYNNLAYIFLQQNEPDKAIASALKALDIFPKYGDAYLNLARGYVAKGLIPQAREAYAAAGQINPALKPTIDQELSRIK